jgi:17beta-estradiol 17-dehydrogenase / very-long-chain 3-oxoacyl-CoA reductase
MEMSCCLWDSLFNGLCWIVTSWLTFRLMKFLYIIPNTIYAHFIAKPYDISHLLDSWTVATGCTDGIGRAYVEELARARGVRKFYLIGRNKSKLETLTKVLTENYGCQVKTLVFDFETDDLDKLPAELSEMDVGILFNCAGIAPTQVANFVELEPGLPSKIVRVNLMSCVKMIELILPGMIKRDRGIVVNIGSVTGWRPLPYMSTYPATKAAISFFTNCLVDEFAHTNVKIQCLIPLLVATKIASYEEKEANGIWVTDTRSYAKQAVNIIGNFPLSTGCFLHDVQIAFGALVSFWLFKQIFVPFGMLRIHRNRVKAYQERISAAMKTD